MHVGGRIVSMILTVLSRVYKHDHGTEVEKSQRGCAWRGSTDELLTAWTSVVESCWDGWCLDGVEMMMYLFPDDIKWMMRLRSDRRPGGALLTHAQQGCNRSVDQWSAC